MFDTISFCIGEKTIEINGASFSLGELTTQILNIPKDEYQAMLELATTAFETMYKNKGAGSKVKKSQPHNYYRKESFFENLSNAKQRVSLLSVF